MKNKRFLSLVMAIVLAASLFAGISVTASADEDVVTYTVKSGDYLYKICKNQGLDYYACKSAIMILNGFTTETQLNRVYVGQQIKLPASNAAAATVKTTTTTTTTIGSTTVGTTTSTTAASGDSIYCYLVPHTVVSGETLSSICNALGTSYEKWKSQILDMNNIKSVTHVYAGKSIYIPTTTKPTSGTYLTVVAHKVVSGDTMTSICNNYGIGYNANYSIINGINKDVNLNYIKVGQTVYVPTSKSVSPVNPSPVSPQPVVNTGNSISFVIDGASHGTPYAAVSGTTVNKAQKGAVVSVCGGANNGYALDDTIVVTRADKKANVAVEGGSFTMPDCAVTVKVKYVDAKKITNIPAQNGTFETLVDGFGVNYAKAGAKVIIKAYPDAAFEVSGTPTVEKEGGGTVPVSAKTDGTWFFTMPADNVKVSAAFGSATLYNITPSVSGSGSVKFSVNGTACTAAASGTTITVTGTPSNSKYKLVSVKYTNADGATVNATEKSANVWEFVMPAKDSTVTAAFGYSQGYSLNYKSLTGGGSVLFKIVETGAIQTIAAPGQTVKVIPQPDGFHEFKDWFVRYASTGATISPKSADTFTMPEADVDIYVQFNESAYTYRSIYQIDNVGFNVEVSKDGGATFEQGLKAYAGCIVRITPNVKCSKVETVPAVALTRSGDSFTFTMPDSDVGIKGTADSSEVWVPVSFTSAPFANGSVEVKDSNGTIVIDSTSATISASVLAGRTLVINAAANTDYAVSAIKITIDNSVNGTTTKTIIGESTSYTIARTDTAIKIEAAFVAD